MYEAREVTDRRHVNPCSRHERPRRDLNDSARTEAKKAKMFN